MRLPVGEQPLEAQHHAAALEHDRAVAQARARQQRRPREGDRERGAADVEGNDARAALEDVARKGARARASAARLPPLCLLYFIRVYFAVLTTSFLFSSIVLERRASLVSVVVLGFLFEYY